MNYQLPRKELFLPFKYQEKVLFLNPAQIYNRINVNPFSRHQSPTVIGMQFMFPKPGNKICACGCGQPLPPKRSKWASDECARFAGDVYAIIYGQPEVIRHYLKKYHGCQCKCGRKRKLKVDHIKPVKHGGGGCWLSNYQFLCHLCHVKKTSEDFGWKKGIKNP